MRKNEESSWAKYIENQDNKISMRIQFILEVYVYRQRLLKRLNSMVYFYGQD